MTEAGSQIQVHSSHIVLFAVWFVIFAAAYLRERLRRRRNANPQPQPRSQPQPQGAARPFTGWPVAIAACSLVSAAMHLDVIREHFHESVLYGTFFLLLTAQQLVFAAWVVWRPTPALVRAGGLAALAVVLLWLATRTTGIPIGPAAGEVEPVGRLDVIATAAELLLAVFCVPAWRRLGPARLPVAGRSPRPVTTP